MADELLRRTSGAIHTLFFATEAAGKRHEALRASLSTDAEIEAFQGLSIGLIDLEPLSPELEAGLRQHVDELERRDAERRARKPSERLAINVNEASADAQYARRLLERMYARWEGTLDYEAGQHRFVFYSQADEECRRCSVFASVAVDGHCPDLVARSYILGPYLLVKDERTHRESSDPWKVLAGDLTPILPEIEA